MLISELPESIRILALQRQKEDASEIYGDNKTTDELIDAFDWRETLEGDDYWGSVDEGDFEENDELIFK